jgi:hypothetical protein
MWSGGTKTGWVASTNPPTMMIFPILSTKKRSVQKTNVRSCPTLCSYPHIAIQKYDIVCAKKAHYLRILGAKKRRPYMASILHEHHPSSAYATYTRHLY